jgi:inorganic phosphate transporter, PiT family
LLASPFIAIILTAVIYFMMHKMRKTLGITRKSCLCVGEKVIPMSVLGLEKGQVLTNTEIKLPEVFVGNEQTCKAKAIEIYEGKMFGVSAQPALDFLHFMSAGAVSFARGLNDTPKIVALFVLAGVFGLRLNIFLVAIVMAMGGILGARKVAETVSHRITGMNHGQGFTANLITAFLVIFASHLGVPVSTTHVSCGSLFGIGLVNGKARWNVIGGIVSAWVLTLPTAAILSAVCYGALEGLI